MRICFVASEVAPLAKTGGLADVAGALPRHLHDQGHDVRVFMPFYSSIGTAALQMVPVDGAQNVELRLGAHLYRYSLLETQLPGSERAAVSRALPRGLRPPDDLHDRGRRASAFPGPAACRARRLPAHAVRAAHRSLQRLAHGAAADAAQDAVRVGQRVPRGRARVMSIHNIGYQGLFDASTTYDVGGDVWDLLAPETLRRRRIQLAARRCAQRRCSHDGESDVRGGNLHAARRPWPRRHAARAARRRRRHSQRRRLHASGIPRPIAISSITIRRQDLSGKAQTKRALLDWLNLPVDRRAPLLGMVTRLTVQKGIDLLFDALPEILATRDLSLRRARQRRSALRRVSSRACSSAFPIASCSIAATARSSRT